MNQRVGSLQPIRFGTRGSELALNQTNLVISRLCTVYPDIVADVHVVRTEGDRDRSSPLSEIGGRGVFTNAIEREIRGGQADAAVHSAKDLPTEIDPAIPIVALPVRDDPRDVLISRHNVGLDELPANPVIGTSSRRREAQIRQLRPDARFVNLRGNVDTRLHKARNSDLDAIVVAAAGVLRLGLGDQISEFFDVRRVVPSPGQGAIAVQARAGSPAASLLETIDDPLVSRPVRLERVFLAAIGAGCSMPVGAYVHANGEGINLVAMLADSAGRRVVVRDVPLAARDEAKQVSEIAARMLDELAEAARRQAWSGWTTHTADLAGARVVVTRPRAQAGPLLTALEERGAEPVSLPTIRIVPVPDTSALDAALAAAASEGFAWIVFTSANAVRVVAVRLDALGIAGDRLARVKFAAVGPATATAAGEAGLNVAVTAQVNNAEWLAAELRDRLEAHERVLYPRSAVGRDALPDALRAAGVDLITVDAYRTIPEPDVDPRVLKRILQDEIDVITFSSPSSVRNLLVMLPEARRAVTSIPAVCGGPVTAAAARAEGFLVAGVGEDPSPRAVAEAVAVYWRSRAQHEQDSDARLVPVE